jgi:hypothetical protein
LKNENLTNNKDYRKQLFMQSICMTLVQKYIKLVVTVFYDTVLGAKVILRKFKINFSEFVPGSDADMVNLKYTWLSRITAILVSSKMLDYTGVYSFLLPNFKSGIDVTLFRIKCKETSKIHYAISCRNQHYWFTRKSKKISTEEGKSLETEQLYFN